MEIIEVTPEEYSNVMQFPMTVFHKSNFNLLNRSRCESLRFLLFKDSKFRLGLIAGINKDSLLSPFSAPYGGFDFVGDSLSVELIENALTALESFAVKQSILKIEITYPPLVYNETLFSKLINIHNRINYEICAIDLDYYFNLNNFTSEYRNKIKHSARKNLKISLRNNLVFRHDEDENFKKNVYQIIKKNREERGFPLRMTFDQVMRTGEVIDADFFMVSQGEKDIAAAIVFDVNDSVSQVIYWGDLPEFSGVRPMNFLSYNLFEFYKNRNKKILDIGPSTDGGVPNYGLCEFKENIGCEISLKYSFEKFLK
jgi:hypothetical protein